MKCNDQNGCSWRLIPVVNHCWSPVADDEVTQLTRSLARTPTAMLCLGCALVHLCIATTMCVAVESDLDQCCASGLGGDSSGTKPTAHPLTCCHNMSYTSQYVANDGVSERSSTRFSAMPTRATGGKNPPSIRWRVCLLISNTSNHPLTSCHDISYLS